MSQESMEDILKEARTLEAHYRFQQLRNKLAKIVGGLLLLNLIGIVITMILNSKGNQQDYFFWIGIILFIYPAISGVMAVLGSIMPSLNRNDIQQMVILFFIFMLIFLGLNSIIVGIDLFL